MLTLFNESWQDLWRSHEPHEHELGAVFTKPEVVSLILDLAGYKVGGERLATYRFLEPSCGDGAFLKEVVARLIESEVASGGTAGWQDELLTSAIRAVDVDERSLAKARCSIRTQLTEAGCPGERAHELAEAWTVHSDFLLGDWSAPFDFVVGNPPYVRIEAVAKSLLAEYRRTYSTLSNRADLYVAFIEKGLKLLSGRGVLAYICANRFAKNQYGGALRTLIAKKYHVRYYLNLEHTQPFLAEVSAYPAIVVVDREVGAPTSAGTLEDLDPKTFQAILSTPSKDVLSPLSQFAEWYRNGGPWVATAKSHHASWQRLVATFPTLEESAPGTKVGIGVATGADKVFILPGRSADIEDSRQIPLALPRDVTNASIDWSNHYLINPFASEDRTGLVDLNNYPGLAAYLHHWREGLERRHVAKSRPQAWFRTIDRIWPSLQFRPKLLIPDIQKQTIIGYDEGHFYPHHNLYWITSDTWDLRALKTILRSTAVLDQVRAYSVQMRGGSLRFQAQTLRRVRVPELSSLTPKTLESLVELATCDDQAEIDYVVGRIYRRECVPDAKD